MLTCPKRHARSVHHPSQCKASSIVTVFGRLFSPIPNELTASAVLSWVKCGICILMGCYRVINATVRMHYPRSELKGSFPNRSCHKRGGGGGGGV
uniref:Uncharacterized protein n=1 Tax=Electrophorus electricus TaxID=8005 RepID=A0A4W4F2X1_ELEEL